MQTESKKKFGLILSTKNKVNIVQSVFNQGDDDDQSSKFNLSDQSKSKTFIKKQTQLRIEEALSQDANIFDYDASYEDDKRQREEKAEAKFKEVCQASKPKYMGGLLRQAEERKKEKLRRGERKVAKERKEEEVEGLFLDKERYETEAYKESRKRMEEEQKERDEALQEVDSGDFSGFYKHLFDQKTKNYKDEHDNETKEEIKNIDKTQIKVEVGELKGDEKSSKKAKYDDRKDGEKNKEDKRDKRRGKNVNEEKEMEKRNRDKDEKYHKKKDNGEEKVKEIERATKVVPNKHTTDIQEARARYMARKNKPI